MRHAQQGTITTPHLADQTEQAWCSTVPTDAVITWTTEYDQPAVRNLRAGGRDVPDELPAHISPHPQRVRPPRPAVEPSLRP
ncbi:Tn3 family transposase [Nonomuraea sp. NPDC005501]|uniref:Tn3 family transposase n=1 Tax=Nonomuraea sp. NPDC005501 TaxID=3156884 RepID=UPI0033B529C0